MSDIPPQLKEDNWTFHALARSDDPAVKVLNTRNLVTNLIATMKIAGIIEYDDLLKDQIIGANSAMKEYFDVKNQGKAIEIAYAVQDKIIFMVYDKRFATPIQNSFGRRGGT